MKFETEETARYTDIDMHHHVNNAVYVNWIENIMGNILPNKIKRFKIQFSNELKLGDKVSIFTKNNRLIVSNPTQPRSDKSESSQTGIRNMRFRFQFFTDEKIEVIHDKKTFTVSLPLITKK